MKEVLEWFLVFFVGGCCGLCMSLYWNLLFGTNDFIALPVLSVSYFAVFWAVMS